MPEQTTTEQAPALAKLEWKTERRKISDLIEFEDNPRQMTEEQVSQLTRSLEKFNLVEIPAINLDNKIVAGHQRLKIMAMLGRGEEQIDVRVPNRQLTEDEFKEYNLRSNKNTGDWDWEVMADAFDIEMLKDVGFSEELDNFNRDSEDDPEVEPDNEKPAITKLGDLYILGKHKLLCGDSMEQKNINQLICKEKIDMVFTDPPYNIGYDYWDYIDNKDAVKYKEWCEKWFAILNKISPIILLTIGQWNMKMWFEIAKPLGIINWVAKNKTSGSKISHFGIWEPILVYAKKINKNKFNKSDSIENDIVKNDDAFLNEVEQAKKFVAENSDVIEINNKRQKDIGIHKCPKQVDLLVELLLRYSKPGDLILDIFLGSGSTLIGCEKTNRVCYGIELDPKYCDIIVQRWEKYTNKKAEKVSI